MPDVHARLERAGLTLPDPPAPVANYVPAAIVTSGRLLSVSGQIPVEGGVPIATGPVPDPVGVDLARRCARRCVLNALAAVHAETGDLGVVRRVVRLDAFVACAPGFTEQPKVADGASELLVELFGDSGRHTRAAVGVTALPLGVPVEIAFMFLID